MFPFVQLPLRSHLLIFGLLCFVPAFLAIAYISRSFALSEQNRVLERADQLTYQFGRNIAEEVAKAQEVLTALATSPSIAVRDWAAFQAQAEIVAGANDAAIALRTPDRQQLINTLIPFGSRPLPVTTDPTLKSADDVVLQTRRPTVSDLYFGASGNQPFIAVIVPVMDGTDLAYLLTMAISPSKVAKGLRFPAGAEYQEWLAVLTGRDERIIARTRNQSEYIGQRATGNMLESLQHAASGQLRTMTLDGVAVHTSFRRNDNGWTTIVSVPNEVLQQPVRALVLPLLAIVATVLVSSALGAWAYGGVIGRELSKLETTAGRVGVSNDLSPSRSSIGEVARIERAMLAANERIKMLVAELDHRVKNTLAIIVSVVSRSVSEERERFVIGGRIMALSVAHEA